MEIKLRAVREGRKLKNEMAGLLRRGLNAPDEAVPNEDAAMIRTSPTTGFPVIVPQFRPTKPGGFSPQELADILGGTGSRAAS